MDTSERRSLYPVVEPNHSAYLRVDDTHELYYEDCGNPQGKPVVMLHGGPGGGCSPDMRRFYNADIYRIVLFDQRGCGRSRPHACLKDNTTWNLVDDIEVLRAALQIEKWQVFGGSWGSTLALAYAQAHPERISELVLRGIFLARQKEQDWIYRFGASELYPQEWREFTRPIPIGERDNMPLAYYQRLTGENEAEALRLAGIWSAWEARTICLLPNDDVLKAMTDPHLALAIARIECHYFVKNCFMEEGQLLRDIDRVRNIPAVIVHGRYDVLCPPINAWDLSQAWPEADLRIVPDAGHSAFEPGNVHELVEAGDKFAAN